MGKGLAGTGRKGAGVSIQAAGARREGLAPRGRVRLSGRRGGGAARRAGATGGRAMKETGRLLWLVLGLALGGAGVALYLGHHPQARAGNDRYEDYILCTGAVAVNPRAPTDGVWLLDYRAG